METITCLNNPFPTLSVFKSTFTGRSSILILFGDIKVSFFKFSV